MRRTTIKTTCTVCGDVDLTPGDVRLVVCSNPDWSYYAFGCPSCGGGVRRDADDEAVGLLVSAGVRVESWHVPGEVFEAKGGPALTVDDVLDFVLELGSGDCLAGEVSS